MAATDPKFQSVDYDPGPPAGTIFEFTDDELPARPSSYYIEQIDEDSGDVVHSRHGHPIAVYPVDFRGVWRVEMIYVSKTNAELIKGFKRLGNFLYFPDKSLSTSFLVHIPEQPWRAVLVGGGVGTPRFDLGFTLKALV